MHSKDTYIPPINIHNFKKTNRTDLVTLYKMSFVYNAIINGWTVRKLKNNKYEFTNSNEEIKKEFFLENFLNKFINTNLTINHIIKEETL